MRQQCVTFFSKQQYPCVQFLPVTELHCFPKLHYTASSLLSGSGLYFQNSVPNLDQSKVKALYLFYSSYFCNHMKHNHAIPECWRYGLHTLEASVHSQSHWRIFMVDKVPMGQGPPPQYSKSSPIIINLQMLHIHSPPICRTANKLTRGCSSTQGRQCDCAIREYIYIYIYIYIIHARTHTHTQSKILLI